MPSVTIILLSYNQARFLGAAVDSALAQTHADFEVLALDNGSTDNSPAILRGYEDPRLHVELCQEHAWPSVRFNQAVARARGDFVCFLYSDDRYLPRKLELQVQQLVHLGPSFGVSYGRAIRENVYTGTQVVAPSVAASGHVFESLMRHGLAHGEIDMISPMIRRSLLVDHKFHEDVFFESEAIFHRLSLHTNFGFIPEPLVIASDHDANGGKVLDKHCEMTLDCLVRLRLEPGLSPRSLALIDSYEARLLQYYGWQGARLDAPTRWTLGCYRGAIARSRRTLLQPKALIGVLLCLLPRSIRGAINRLGHAIRRSGLHAVRVDTYEALRPDLDR